MGHRAGAVASTKRRRHALQEVQIRFETIELFELVSISVGMRGLQILLILLAPAHYLRATGARLGPIAELEW